MNFTTLILAVLASLPVASSTCQPRTLLTHPIGEIVNNNETYANKLSCTWVIKPDCPTECAVVATFDQIALEAGYDFVSIYDGCREVGEGCATAGNAELIGRHTGAVPPGDQIARSGVMTIEFTSDDDTADQGFRLHYHSEPVATLQTFEPTQAQPPPADTCHGDVTLHALQGTITEGQGVYESSTTCSWLIQPQRPDTTIQHVELTFDAFQMEADFDFVTVYDGSTTEAATIGRFSGDTLPPLVTSTGPTMLLVFSTDHSGVGEGFVAHWTTVTQGGQTGHVDSCPGWECAATNSVPGDICTDGATYVCCDQAHSQCAMPPCWFPERCPAPQQPGEPNVVTSSPAQQATEAEPCLGQKLLSGDHGTLSEGPGQYGSNAKCEWLIDPSCAGTCGIILNFTSFALEAGYDFLTVYDGQTADSPVVGRYTGSNTPKDVIAPSGKMLLEFTSDEDTADDGFEATWSVVHGSVTMPPSSSDTCQANTRLTAREGDLQDGSGNYENGASCAWLIQPDPPLSAGQFILLRFDEFSTEQYYDIVTVYDGSEPSDPLLGRFSGSTVPGPITASTGSMLIVFSADNSERKEGFKAHFSISSSAAPTMPPTAPLSAELAYIQQQGHMPGMEMPYPVWLAIQAEFAKLQPGALVSGRIVSVEPRDACTDLSNAPALHGNIALIDRGTCTFVSKTQRVQDAGALMAVIINVNGSALIMGGVSETIHIPALSVSVTTGSEIRDQLDITQNQLMINTLLHEPAESPPGGGGGVPVAPGPMTVAPSASSSSDGPCEGINLLTEASGTFSEGPGRYPNNAKCEWLIRPPCAEPPCQISLTFSQFALEAGYDFVTVYNGASTASDMINRFSGKEIPAPVIATSDVMLVVFTTDEGTTDDGFTATFSSMHSTATVTHAPSAMFTGECSGQTVLTDEQGIFTEAPGKYPNGATCSWLIKPSTASTQHLYVVLSFDKFSTEENYDFLTVFDGEDTSAPKIGTFSGSKIPHSVSSSHGAMLVVFTSDSSGSDEGFTAHWSTSTTAAPTHPPTAPVSAEVVHLTQTKPVGNYKRSWLGLISAFGPRVPPEGIAGQVVMANPIDACDQLHNKAVIKGKIVLVHRGTCTFVRKIQRCQEAHASAVIVVNIQGNGDPLIMAGDGLGVLIPSFSISKSIGDEISQGIPGIELQVSSQQNPIAPPASGSSPNTHTASSSSTSEISPGTPVILKLVPHSPRNYRALVLHASQLTVHVERMDPQMSAILRVYVNLGSVASASEFVASNSGTSSTASSFDVSVLNPLEGRFYYVSVMSEKEEMVKVSVTMTPNLAALSPVGAVFVSVGIIALIGLAIFGVLTYRKRLQKKRGFVELREVDPGAPFVVGQVVN